MSYTSAQIDHLLGGSFGELPASQIKRLSNEFSQSVETVTHEALVISQANHYDPARGPMQPYLWSTLRAKLAAMRGLRTEPLDELQAPGFDYLEPLSESRIPADVYERDWSHDPELKDLIDAIRPLSGKSTADLATEWRCTRRNVNYRLQKLLRRIEDYLRRDNKK